MQICVAGTRVTLADPTVFDAFDVAAPGLTVDEVLVALDEAGAPCAEEGHVFVSISAVRSMAGDAADDQWEDQFQAMLAYAKSKGWLSDDGQMIKAHISTL